MSSQHAARKVKPALRIGVCYDFRNPPDSGVSDQHLYAEIMEQVKWLDSIGADLVWFTEHHFVEDGYLPSWIPVASAMASVTSHVRFGTDICLMPFNHPIRLAEDLIDLIKTQAVAKRERSGNKLDEVSITVALIGDSRTGKSETAEKMEGVLNLQLV